MLELAIAACRDPKPGRGGEALEQIGSALIAARALLDVEGGGAPRSTSSSARGRAPPPSCRDRAPRQPQRQHRLPPVATALARSAAKALSERPAATSSACSREAARLVDQRRSLPGRVLEARHRVGQIQQQRSQQVGEHHAQRRPAGRSVRPSSGSAGPQVEAAHLDRARR